MISNNTSKNIKDFHCAICDFNCIKKGDYTRHLSTAKHIRITSGNIDTPKNPILFECKCGKKYNFRSGLSAHKSKCTFQLEKSQEVASTQEGDKRDDMIDKLVNSTTEMKEMMLMMMKSQMHSQESTKEILKETIQETQRQNQESTKEILKETIQETQRQNQETIQETQRQNQETLQETQRQNQETTKEILKETIQETQRQNQETTKEIIKGTQDSTVNLVNKVIEVLPQIGNTTNNNNNNTLNFYLNNTCKDAESIHDFTDRFIERVVYFFKGNYRDIAYKRISLPDNVRDIFYECLDENPQTQNFVQTTDVKNGVFYVKEKKKNDDCQFYGEAEFVKYRDGFAKSGTRLGHAINCALLPCKSECLPILERDFKAKPNEDDYDEEHEEEFQKDKDTYYNTTRTIQDNLMFQTINAMNIFDNKRVRESTLTKTKRQKNET
jgi:hypothetical protein